ncbi:MAG: hypothetical protein HZC55_13830 [Verrucomicrobia bacterium]|nr:hypothetical protein [Verrucomicrobiota bacterium]
MKTGHSSPTPADRGDPPGRRVRGFALLLTVTLLAFLVVVLMGLAAYTRVETAVAGTMQRQAQARENALLALNIAVGQLQKYAGSDRRVTATADAFSPVSGRRWYTGVWDSTNSEKDPVTWLVSGNERYDSAGVATPLSVTPATTAGPTVALISSNTSTANDVVVPLQGITAIGVPGFAATARPTIGRYGWWVGDQGVKAPVALQDRALDTAASASTATTVSYVPYDAVELRRRIRQQVPMGAGAANAAAAAVFEPRTSSGASPPNSTLADRTLAFNQLGFLKNSSNAAIGLGTLRTYFQHWSPDNKAVLANTKDGGLRRDLSLRPDLLGSAFAAWVNYPAYMEVPDPAAASAPLAVPEIASAESMRRRYRITPPLVEGEQAHRVAPVLAFCMLNFDSRTVGGTDEEAPIETRLRWVIGLWNPYTSALVPEDLRIEITGLPDVMEFAADADPGSPTLATVSPSAMFGAPVRLRLPWEFDRTDLQDDGTPKPDVASWLPGRVYYWRSEGNTEEPENGNEGHFYNKSLVGTSHAVTRVSPSVITGVAPGGWRVPVPTQLTVKVFRKNDTEPLGTYISPTFDAFFATDPQADPEVLPKASDGGYEFSFLFRLNAAGASGWLVERGRDPRNPALADTAFVPGANGPLPSAYPGVPTPYNNDLLLERVMGNSGRSYNRDVPVFELPRAPVLSLGSLQHLLLPGARPFAVGNPWGSQQEIASGVPANAIFDRYFLSGLAAPVTAGVDSLLGSAVTVPLPNPLLQVLPRKPDGSATLLSDVLGVQNSTQEPSEGFSSKHLLQRGAFNVNSTSALAWIAVLRSSRFANGEAFRYINSSSSTGTAGSDTSVASTTPTQATFFRFPQSAQETYEADLPVVMNLEGTETVVTYAASTTVTGTDPDVPSAANTHLYRRGVRALSDAETVRLANAIVGWVKAKLADSGPFRSIEDFLAPRAIFAGPNGDRSLLEAAIEDAELNKDVPEFSSQFLTPGDIMTALAPVLFPRSDTFVVRTYGEAINPATGTVEGRAWCEALVQRVPEYVDPLADIPEVLPDSLSSEVNRQHGRRFKVVSFRWLTRSDI